MALRRKTEEEFEAEELDEMGMTAKQREASDKCTWLKFGWKFFRVEINPIVTLGSAVVIWGVIIWSMVKPEQALETFKPWMPWITKTFTWLYVGTQDVWFLVIVGIMLSKFGKIKLGKDKEKPEFNNTAYFTMLFAAGVGIGLFYFGVAEPVFHYRPGEYGNRYYQRYTDNVQAQDAINLTFFHWGVHAWIVYVLVGLLMALSTYRFDLPMSIRSCFYPLIGEKIYGFIGDIIDVLSVVATMYGVCTSLGLGAMQLNTGLYRISDGVVEINTTNQVIIIWAITAIATISVVSGLKVGVRRLSEICFGIGMLLMVIILLIDETWYMLNVYVQSIGYYLQYVIQLGFHTDAFAQQATAPDSHEAPLWMNDWTIFYWGWWIAWCPFVGMFIAKISRGRTVFEFCMYTMTIPCIYVFLWFSIFGGMGIKMERLAEAANITCDSACGGKDSMDSCDGLFRLSCRPSTAMWFDLMYYYEDISGFLVIVSLIGLTLYFVTSSDSGSLVIDSLSANGHPDPPKPQRIFWALTEGACATGLLVAGGTEALQAMQTMSIASGLFYTVLLNFMTIALWRLLKIDCGELDVSMSFSMDMLDVFYNLKKLMYAIVAIFVPFYFTGIANGKLQHSKKQAYGTMIASAILFYGWVVLMICEVWITGISYIGWALYMAFATYSAGIRIHMRETFEINGNMAEDFFAFLIGYPAASIQMYFHMEDEKRHLQDKIDNPDRRASEANGGHVNAYPNKAYVKDERPSPYYMGKSYEMA